VSDTLPAPRREAHVHLTLSWRAWDGDESVGLEFPACCTVAVFPCGAIQVAARG
jgi:hypothetical protein